MGGASRLSATIRKFHAMSSKVNLNQVLFAHAKWRLKLLVPCWTFQIIVLLCLMGIFAYRVVDTVEHYSEEKENGSIPMVEIVYVLGIILRTN